MTPEQMERALKRLGWSGAELARRLGVSRVTVNRYRRAERKVSERAEKLLRSELRGRPRSPA